MDITDNPNEFVEKDDWIEIKLERRNGDVYWCIIDKEDYEKVKNYRWNCLPNYYVTTNMKINGVYKMIRIHSLIMDNIRSGKMIDHINGNPLDNRKLNLRICTRSENVQNKSKLKRNKSLFKGVYFRSDTKLYYAAIRFKRKLYTVGIHKDQIDSAIAYDIAALTLFGNNAHINFPFMVGYSESEIPRHIIGKIHRVLKDIT